MNKFIATFCIIGTALVLSACESAYSKHSGSGYAYDRTAGSVDAMAAKKSSSRSNRVFRSVQSK